MGNILLILVSVSLNAAAQVLMRTGMLKVGEVSISAQALFKALPAMVGNGFLWLSIGCYGVSIITWMMILSRVEVSFAYAFSSLGFVLVTVLGYIFLKEHISVIRIIGIAIVCVGIILVARS
ncbi:MAG: EamA family transporter [Treponema sp.]|nr:EamA family transporter [Treponema sp.]